MSLLKKNKSNKPFLSHIKDRKGLSVWLYALFFCIAAGIICNIFYNQSPNYVVQTDNFQKVLTEKENKAAIVLNGLKEIITHSSIDSLGYYSFDDDEISYYVFDKDKLCYWSDNSIVISPAIFKNASGCQYIQLSNVHCVCKTLSFGDKKILALITIKYNYPYENKELTNNFARDFNIDKQIGIARGESTDKQAIFCVEGNYLFSLARPQTPIYNETWAILGLIAFVLVFFIFFVLYSRLPYLLNKRKIHLKLFLRSAILVGAITGLCLYFNFPSLLFWNKLFTPFQYASNPLLATIIHLTIATAYFTATIYLFYFYVNIRRLKTLKNRIYLLVLFLFHFIVIYYLLNGIVYHSSVQLIILQFTDLSGITAWIHFLILIWGIGLALVFYKSHRWFYENKKLKQSLIIDLCFSVILLLFFWLFYRTEAIKISVSFFVVVTIFYIPFFRKNTKNRNRYLAICIFLLTAFITINSVIITKNKKLDKYKIIAQNISINGNADNDRMADILLEDLNSQINKDDTIGKLIKNPDSLLLVSEYLNQTYLRGFWNRYEMRLFAAKLGTPVYNSYRQLIRKSGYQIKRTQFYNIPTNENNLSYLGFFKASKNRKDSMYFFMEFYLRRNFKSYSFPNLLISKTVDIQSQLNIGIAKYEYKKLVYSSGKVDFPTNSIWIPESNLNFFTTEYNNKIYYVYAPNKDTYFVISEQQSHHYLSYFLYFLYTFISFFIASYVIIWCFTLKQRRKETLRPGLTAKFQYTFIILLIISFILIFYVSVDFIQKKYQEQQITNLESKKSYIQKALQDLYYWHQDLTAQNKKALSFDLQDLSYLYHTDIHVYDNRGELVASSQPIIFNRNLISRRIAPTPYFTSDANTYQYEHIGQLNYLNSYTDFYNGDFLQIGYIAVPQFFSQDEIQSEIEGLLAVVIHIYLIIIVLAVLLSLLIGKQLSAPLKILENKLKAMRLGQRNEKIDYKLNDEIGQLVMQYNRTVDELEQSARLLAKSERESAWKSMARQVAHEINNPLTPMKLSIQQLQRTKKMNDERFDDYFEKSTAMLIEQIDNLSRIAGTFSDFARMPEANFERVDIAARLHAAVQLFIHSNENIQVDYLGHETDIFVYADPKQLVQVFNNLLKNAIQAIPDIRKGLIQVSIKTVHENVIIDIADNGIGIDEETSEKLFMPNFTTKSNGMGLGLAIAKNIIELSGGSISVKSQNNLGATFTIQLPKAK